MKKNSYKFLNIKGAVLDNFQLQEYMKKVASSHTIVANSNKYTYPIPRVKENFKFIEKTYIVLNEHLKKGIDIYPAGEWLLDNFYIIEEAIKTVTQELPLKKYKKFPSIENGENKGFARIYVLASETIAYTDSKINDEILKMVLSSYQERKSLSMDEIWNLGLFLQIAIIENIRAICEKIYSTQIQKYKVENIIERLVEKKSTSEQKFKIFDIKFKNPYKEMKYPFIEYMSYKLKQYGKQGLPYLNILEEQVNKMGMTISEVIQKEHFDIAIKKVSIGNSITSIKEIIHVNILDLFEDINGIETLLKKDPAQVYDKMDYKTKEYYRNRIKEIGSKIKISEIYIVNKILEKAQKFETIDKKSHIGYYLIDEGYSELIKELGFHKTTNKSFKYIFSIFIATTILDFLFCIYIYYLSRNLLITVISFILSYIPVSEICIKIINYILSKRSKQKLIPKLDFSKGIPKEQTTFVVVPTIIKNVKKVSELFKKLEVYYLANKSENIYFALLGDSAAENSENKDYDEEVIKAGLKETELLNKKYKGVDQNPKFNFLYRKRKWNANEKSYLGWERKRGLLDQFNEFLIKGTDDFRINTIKSRIPIKYIITLDSDTELPLDTGLELIGAMAHILNKPEIESGVVSKGHAIIQPLVGTNLEASRKSLFTRIFAGVGGTDLYSTALFDVYQDNFEEAIFTGKGIYDLKVFYDILHDEIPENTVLSHDLLEGSYLRCGLATDILLLDGYPFKYNSFMSRLSRWIRGDWQIYEWLKDSIETRNGKKKNPLNTLSKFKILDNLRRSLLPISVFVLFILAIVIKLKLNINSWGIVLLAVISYISSTIIDILNFIIFKKNIEPTFISAKKNIVPVIGSIRATILRGFLELIFVPDKMYKSAVSIIKAIYRMRISKQNLLEWTTAEEAENNSKTDLISYYKNMYINMAVGIIAIIILIILKSILALIFGIAWILGPIIAWYISKEKKHIPVIEKVTKENKDYILKIGEKTWSFFNDLINEENNFLPPDNYQESRMKKIASRTSPTNIGLGMLAVVSAYDLKYIKKDKMLNILKKMIDTITRLPKWNGHLYNWYNTITLEALYPRYISTVDSGNFIGYLYTLKQSLINIETEQENKTSNIINEIDIIINNTNFEVLYNSKKRLFSIGFNIEENKLTDSYYDLLASEARQASLIAIAKKDVDSKHWHSLSRTLTTLNRYKGLISWSGTAFEYLMPNININKYEGSLLDESCRFMIMSQKEYAKKLGVPWGISEAAFNLRDLNNNYQYKAFGIPWLGLKRGLKDDIVISPYSIFLSINYEPNEAIKMLEILEKQEMLNKYGFFESIDYTRTRLKYDQDYETVKTYMAHHQGLILLSINNFINDDILIKRFNKNPEIKAVDILLQERMPENAIITKEKKEKIEKQKIKDYENYIEKVYKSEEEILPKTNFISNGEYSICIDTNGEGFSKYKNILINRYKRTSDYSQGIFFYIKNISNKNIWKNSNNCKVSFAPDRSDFAKTEGNIETTTKITVVPEEPIEIRRLEVKNVGTNSETLEITSFFEPVLSNPAQDYAHMVFNNLFLTVEKTDNNNLIVRRRKRDIKQEDIYMGINLYTENETIGDFEYEIDKEKFIGKGNLNTPIIVESSKPYSNNVGLVTDPIVAIKKTLKIEAGESVILELMICIGKNKTEVEERLKRYKNTKITSNVFDLARAKVEAENIYLGIKVKDIENYQRLLNYLLINNSIKKIYMKGIPKEVYSQSELWKYGISGDKEIILVKIKDINDMHVIYELLKAYEYFLTKNVYIDLIILNEETNSYEQSSKFEIEMAILNSQLGYLKNNGIYIININEIDTRDVNLLIFISKIVLDANLGKIENQLDDLEKEYLKTVDLNIQKNEIKLLPLAKETLLLEEFNELKYYNEYGGFSEDNFEYHIKLNRENRLPTVWSMILANKKFGTLITQNLGGFTWNKNSRLNRLSSWNNNPIIDIPSEIIYLKDEENGQIWTLSENLNEELQDYYLSYGFGYVNFKTLSNNIMQELEVFVPKDERVKVNILNLKNMSSTKRRIKLIYYIKPVLDEDEIRTSGFINVWKENNVIFAKNLYSDNFKEEVMYISSNKKIIDFTANKESFIKNRNLKKPIGMQNDHLDNNNGLGENSCIAIQMEIELEAYSNEEIILIIGEENSLLDSKNNAYKYSKIENCKNELENIKRYWKELLTKIQVKTPLESMNIMLNGWAVYQTITSRLWAKTGYYQSGGAIGFRDQLQDTLGLKFIDINFMREQILLSCKHQFIEGDVEHWWHEETSRGIRTKFSDDLLWICYVTNEYIEYTGDYSILELEEPYLDGKTLEDEIDEKYDIYMESERKESIFLHCIRAIDKSLSFGEHGLPKIGSGDWNDGLNTVGNKKKGESIWLGFFLYNILEKFIPICKMKNDVVHSEMYEKTKENLKRALNNFGWDGRWFKRAYMDNGEPLGSIENEECRIDSISQSWGVISNAADNDKKYISMESLENHLIDKENGIIKLLDPPFNKTKLEPGYIKAYLPGVRENGGQYTHAAIWAIIAFTKLGFGDKALEYYRMINPIEHSRTKEAANKYKVEPYVIAADIYGANNLIGRGGWTWYTGSSSWFYKAGIENILGLTIKQGILSINPCIPKEWKEYSIQYKYNNSVYNIKVKNPNNKNTGVETFLFNGKEIKEKQIKLQEDDNINEIEIIM